MNDNYENLIWYSAKKQLNKARKNNFTFKKCTTDSERQSAFEVIKINRNKKGYPLRMSLSDIYKTDNIIEKDFFLVFSDDGIPVGSAIIFHVSNKIVQVVYWGIIQIIQIYQL